MPLLGPLVQTMFNNCRMPTAILCHYCLRLPAFVVTTL